MSVYTLELEGGRYYVGYSDDVPRRIAEHFLGRGAGWTRTHAPVRVLDVVPGGKDLETATTIALMTKYGWRNVRGGPYCSIEMRTLPTPIARALAGRGPREVQVSGRSVEYRDHLIHTEGPPWRARLSGPATLDLAKGVRIFRGETEEEVSQAAEDWVDQTWTPGDLYDHALVERCKTSGDRESETLDAALAKEPDAVQTSREG
jgi:predicted GIY-YIG superfamily endonuclease